MFKRKLTALDFHDSDSFNPNDEAQFRNLIVWLEDQKIRHYKIEDRGQLRNVCAGDWDTAFHQYLEDLGCVITTEERSSLLDWILGYSVRLEYGDAIEKYKNVTAGGMGATAPGKKSTNPIDCLDFESPDFKAGVASLATLLQIPPHQEHTLVLQAICLLIKEKFSKAALGRVQNSPKANNIQENTIPIEKVVLGFETGDYISAEAAKILRLLHVRDLRDLQTRINEAIVHVQALTANPKTDTRLGKVGR